MGDFPALPIGAAVKPTTPDAAQEKAPLPLPPDKEPSDSSADLQLQLALPEVESDTEASFFDVSSPLSPFGSSDEGDS